MWYRWSREETLELLNRISDIQELLEKQLGYDGEAEERKKKGGQHGRPMTGLSNRAMQAAWLVPPPRLPCCCLVVGLGGGPFLLLVVVD